jgi:uncharacterized protein YbjT (DUF2867 family)
MSNTNQQNGKTILVIGANGKTGSRVMQRLAEAGVPVRAASRSTNPSFDWYNNTTWNAALQDIHAAYITFQPDLAVPGAVDIIRDFTNAAVKAGVKKLVLLSGRGEAEAQECEKIVMSSGIDWTIVRASWFSQNFSESYMLEPILAGYVALPVSDTGEPFIDADDIADVVFASLTQKGHEGQLYEVTGPRLLSFRQAVNEIAEATGKPIYYERVSSEEYNSMLLEHGVPGEYVHLINYLFSEILDGRNASVTDGVERALGRKPIDFSEFIRKAIAQGVWNTGVNVQQ